MEIGGQPSKEAVETAPDTVQDYLLIGGSVMAGAHGVQAEGTHQDVLLLTEKDGWEIAQEPLNQYSSIDPDAAKRGLGPGMAFARTVLESGRTRQVRLVVNAGEDAAIADWLGKSKLYWGARGRVRRIQGGATLEGVVWMSSEQDAASSEGYAGKLAAFVANLRSDFRIPNLPFIVATVATSPGLEMELAKFSKTTQYTAAVSAEGLKVSEEDRLGAEGLEELGKRIAGEMLRIRASLPPPPKPPSDMAFVDPHVHAMSVTPLGLRSVAKWMEARNVEKCIVSPLNHKGSRAWTEEERDTLLANFRPYEGRIFRMTVLDPGEVATVAEAVAILKREKDSGAVGFGEHYGSKLMFDDPKNLLLYEACEKVGLPVMFHSDQGKNKVTKGMPEVDRVLKKFPGCTVVAHAYWWRQLEAADRQLQEHSNFYADMSGEVVINVLERDRGYARAFLIRNQDKILWATDEGWWSFGKPSKQMIRHYTFFEALDLPAEVRRKIYRDNAIRVYGLSKTDR